MKNKKNVTDPLPKPWAYDLWKHMSDGHGVTLLESEIEEILRHCRRLDNEAAAPEGSNPATQWLNGGISLGKMAQSLGVDRLACETVAGAIWQALEEKTTAIRIDLLAREKLAEQHMKESQSEGKSFDATAESAMRLAYRIAQQRLQFHLGGCIERTGADV